MRNRIRHIQEEPEGGFTLIELLIVIVVLGILAGIVVFGISTFRGDSELAACRSTLKTVNVAADAFEAKTGSFPTSVDVLLASPAGPGYLKTAPDLNSVGTLSFNTGPHTVTSSKAGCIA